MTLEGARDALEKQRAFMREKEEINASSAETRAKLRAVLEERELGEIERMNAESILQLQERLDQFERNFDTFVEGFMAATVEAMERDQRD